MNFSFGNNSPKPPTTTGLSLGTPATPASTTASGFTMGTPAATGGLTFGATPASTPSFSLGAGAGDSKVARVQTAAVKPVAAAAPLSSTFSLGATPTTTTATPAFPSFGLTPTTSVTPQTSTPGFSFGGSTPATSSVSFGLTPATASTLKLGTATTTTSSLGLTAPPTTLSSITASLAAQPTITFVQLEETINKWTLELQDQEKMFMSQAEQINNWDNLLNSNSEQIILLNNEVASMKLQQQQLDHELDFIKGQQRELEEVLAPLEKQSSEGPSNTDPEREHTYHMAETLDTQLKQMSEDLREVIEHLNESSRTQDNSDPIVQIGRILNAHMNSLHWVDQMTLNIQNQLDNATKLHDIHRRENERSFRISYE